MFVNRVQNTGESLDEYTLVLLDDIIKSFIATNPSAWKAFEMEQAIQRAQLLDPAYGRTRDKNLGLRIAASFPNDHKGNNLLDILQVIVPDLVKNKKKWDVFIKRHPVFMAGYKG